jgi:hypothetical protein
VALAISLTFGFAQNKSTLGIKGGLNFPMKGFSLDQAGDNINSIFTEEKKANGWHAGLFGRAYLGNSFYLGSSISYLHNSSTLIGKVGDVEKSIDFNQSGSMMDAVIGIELLNFLRFQGGVNGMVYFDNTWQNTFNTFGVGYNFGVGVDIWKLTLDVNYYSSFNNHSGEWNGIPLSYNQSNLLVGLGIKF